VIVGDGENNSLSIEQIQAPSIYLFGNYTDLTHDTKINGQDTTTAPVVFDNVLGNVFVLLAAGDDRFSIFRPLSVTVNKVLVIDTDVGNDSVLFARGQVQVGTQMVVDLGDGDDFLLVTRTDVLGDQIIRGGPGNDGISVQQCASRDLAIYAREGFDSVFVYYHAVGNSMLLDGGTDADHFSVRYSALANDSAIFGREGADAIYVSSSLPHRTLIIDGGGDFGYIEIRDVYQFNTYVINEGPAQIRIDGSSFNRLEIIVSRYSDSVWITRCSIEELFAFLGEASDEFRLIATRVNRRGRIDGQGGFDLFAQGGNVVTNLEVIGFEFFPPPQSFTQS
jgi:hypothetical protein